MNKSVKLASVMALAVSGLVTLGNYLEDDTSIDNSLSAQPTSRNQYLSKQFPSFDHKLRELPMNLTHPDETWKAGKNEWHGLYKLGPCSRLPENWSRSLATSMGDGGTWGVVQKATPDNPITVRVRSHSEFLHVTMFEYKDTKFSETPWYKSRIQSPANVKSSYIMALVCETNLNKDRAP